MKIWKKNEERKFPYKQSCPPSTPLHPKPPHDPAPQKSFSEAADYGRGRKRLRKYEVTFHQVSYEVIRGNEGIIKQYAAGRGIYCLPWLSGESDCGRCLICCTGSMIGRLFKLLALLLAAWRGREKKERDFPVSFYNFPCFKMLALSLRPWRDRKKIVIPLFFYNCPCFKLLFPIVQLLEGWGKKTEIF